MRVQVKLHGVLSPATRGRPGRPASFDWQLAETSTAGDLLSALADRCEGAFREALESPDERLPRHIRMFADGELLTSRRQALVLAGEGASGVTVVLLSPMMGG